MVCLRCLRPLNKSLYEHIALTLKKKDFIKNEQAPKKENPTYD